MKMNPEVKGPWLEALRSGEYTQGVTRLRMKNNFCCLGVLCDLHRKAGLGDWGDTDASGEGLLYVPNADGFSDAATLPKAVQEWAGIDANPVVEVLHERLGLEINASIAELNDEGKTFEEIAEIIERDL